MTDSLYETMKQTAMGHWQAYQSPSPFDPRNTLQFRSAECVHKLHPTESIPEAFRSAQHREEYTQALNFLGPPMERASFSLQDLVVDTHQRKATMSFQATIDFKPVGNEPAENGFIAEYVWVMQMNKTGDKIDRVDEFLDPQRGVAHIADKAQKYASFITSQ